MLYHVPDFSVSEGWITLHCMSAPVFIHSFVDGRWGVPPSWPLRIVLWWRRLCRNGGFWSGRIRGISFGRNPSNRCAHCFYVLFCFFPVPWSLQDLSPLTRYWTPSHGSESAESWSLDNQRIPSGHIFFTEKNQETFFYDRLHQLLTSFTLGNEYNATLASLWAGESLEKRGRQV